MTCYQERSKKRSKKRGRRRSKSSSLMIVFTSKDITTANELLLHVITIPYRLPGVTKGGAITCIKRFNAVLGVT